MTNVKENNESKASDKPMSDDEIIAIAKQRFQLAQEAEAENRIQELDDLRFMVGEQWPDDIRRLREQDSRPCLTINRIPQFVRQVTNDQRQNRPSIKVNPVDDHADVDTAKVFQGIIRHIEYSSHADTAYDTAFEGAAKSGLGYWRLLTEYADPMSFQQEIKIKRIKDRMSVYVDPFYQEPDGSDMCWGFVFEEMSKDEFQAQFPDAELSKMSDWDSLGNASNGWVRKDGVRVAEYLYKVYESEDICLLSDGRTVVKKDLPPEMPQGVRVISERKTLIPKIKWCKMNGLNILEKTDLPGEWIPIIPVVGEDEIVDGKRVISGIIRHAKDPQRMYNYWKSSQTETIALAPRAPYLGAEGQFEGHEAEWQTANQKNHPYLEYKSKDSSGQPQGPPQRQVFEPPVQAITQASTEAAEDLKATTGIYDASLGNRSNEQSGIAIQRRNTQSQTSNFHYIDNLSRSLRHTGRILIKWIPKIYDTSQAVRVIGEGGDIDMVKINQVFDDGGDSKSYFLEHGRYDCTVDTGPSFQTKRQEAVASMIDLTKTSPQIMQIAGDLMVKNMDWPGAQEIAERLKKMLPPQLQEDDKDQKPLPPQIQAQMSQMNQMIQTLADQNDEHLKIINGKMLELASRERIAALQAQTQLAVEQLKHHAKDGQIAFQEEMAEIQHLRETQDAQINQMQSMQQQPQMPQQPHTDNDAGGSPAMAPNSYQPTGGSSPGQNLGEHP